MSSGRFGSTQRACNRFGIATNAIAEHLEIHDPEIPHELYRLARELLYEFWTAVMNRPEVILTIRCAGRETRSVFVFGLAPSLAMFTEK